MDWNKTVDKYTTNEMPSGSSEVFSAESSGDSSEATALESAGDSQYFQHQVR
jgi:hypothetical protein